jgi:hypothetical protein
MAKGKPLVSQHLENISRGALEKRQNIVRRYISEGARMRKPSSLASIGLFYNFSV